jgi:hypothetical protein
MARALLPDLAKDLKRLEEQRVGSDGCEARADINSPAADPPELNRASNACQGNLSMVQKSKEGTVKEDPLPRSRIPANQKGKQIDASEGIHGGQHTDSFLEPQVYCTATSGKKTVALSNVASSSGKEYQRSFTISEEGWELARPPRRRRDAVPETKTIQSTKLPRFKIEGFEFFRKKLVGKCFNCFSPNHISRVCRASYRCWKCYHSGHRAAECRSTSLPPQLHKSRLL